MAETFFYKGRHIELRLTERTFENWYWSYTIDGHGFFPNQGAPFSSRVLATIDATRDAKLRVDRAPK